MTIYRVRVLDGNHTGPQTFLIEGKDIGQVAQKAMKHVRKNADPLVKSEEPHDFYIDAIERIGEVAA